MKLKNLKLNHHSQATDCKVNRNVEAKKAVEIMGRKILEDLSS
jgi:hypothetical protein